MIQGCKSCSWPHPGTTDRRESKPWVQGDEKSCHPVVGLEMGKSHKLPRRCHCINKMPLPLLYIFSCRAWIAALIFKEWFYQEICDSRLQIFEEAGLWGQNCPLTRWTHFKERQDFCSVPAEKHYQSHPAPGSGNHLKLPSKTTGKNSSKPSYLTAETSPASWKLPMSRSSSTNYFGAAAWDAVKQTSIYNMREIFGEKEPEDEDLCGFSKEDIRQERGTGPLSLFQPEDSLKESLLAPSPCTQSVT